MSVRRRQRERARAAYAGVVSRCAPPPFPPASSLQPPACRRGVTLVELLITMVIISIISAAILGTASAALESARRSRTRTMVTRIHTLLMERLATYEGRRIPINGSILNSINQISTGAQTSAANVNQSLKLRSLVLADVRLLALRELMKYEMPDHWADVSEPPVFLADRPTIAKTCLRRLQQMQASASQNIERFQGAECLYLTVMQGTGDGEARTLFSAQDIGDVDEDGAPEFLDGWGQPISWLRWPAGFVVRSQVMTGDAAAEHDPFDPYRRDDPTAMPTANQYPTIASLDVKPYITALRDDVPAFRIVPLVYSAGADGISDVKAAKTSYFNPFEKDANGYIIGRPEDDVNQPNNEDNSLDNIHSHLIDY
jgi:prepilin-type N-terminal cleavage/methylation domain-containing protein